MARDDDRRRPVEREEKLEKASREQREVAHEIIREDRQVVRDELPPVLPPEESE